MPHADFEVRQKNMWNAFFEKDYTTAATTAADLLRDSLAFDAIHVAGLSLTALDQLDEGVDWCCASLALSNAAAAWYTNAAIAFKEKKDYPHTLLFLKNGLEKYPDDVRMNYMQCLCMAEMQSWEQAIGYADQTLTVDPKFYHAKLTKGFCCHMLGRYEEAIELYKSLYDVAAPEDREEAVNNHACVLLEMGKHREALALLDYEYDDSRRPGTIYNRSFIRLGIGEWPEAWDMYRQRATVQVSGDQGMPVVDQVTAKTLDDLKGKHLFLFHEQGLGDSLQFIRYASMLRPLVSNLTIGVPKTFKRLAENLRLNQSFTVVADGTDSVIGECDIALPMLDCPAVFGTTVDTIPGGIPYFNVPDELIAQRQMPDTNKVRVGLVWAGASRVENIRAHSIDKRRSIPFEMMDPLLALHNSVQFVSLQMSDHRVEDDRLLQPLQDDFDVLDTAAVMSQLDLVVTIDSSMAHLAGALGIPVWMLSRFDGCWRWFYNDIEEFQTISPWYPTMKIYRQTEPSSWPVVVDKVVHDLKKHYGIR